jgi:hypothetical protein
MVFFFFLKHNSKLNLPLAPPNQIHWQRANRSFTPLGLNLGPFLNPKVPECEWLMFSPQNTPWWQIMCSIPLHLVFSIKTCCADVILKAFI